MHTDTMGTPYAATNGIGNLSEVYDIGPYGEYSVTDVDGGGTLGNRIGLAGMWYDSVTILYFMRARHYSPFLKRFVSRDPIGVWGDSINRGCAYGYVGGRPTVLTDPTGLGWFKDLVAGAIDGAISGVTFGLVETTIAANALGADTSSTAYAAGNIVGDVVGGIAANAATGGAGSVARVARAVAAVGNVNDAVQLTVSGVGAANAAASGDFSAAADLLKQATLDQVAKAVGNGANPPGPHRPQHGKPDHDGTAYQKGVEWENDPDTVPGTVGFNSDLRRPDGTIVPGHRPDVQRVRRTKDGKFVTDVHEVQSDSQSKTYMKRKTKRIHRDLGGDAGRVTWNPPKPGARRPPPRVRDDDDDRDQGQRPSGK